MCDRESYMKMTRGTITQQDEQHRTKTTTNI